MNSASKNEKSWFPGAKLGIFLHWGIYSVGGMDASWPFFSGKVSHEEYMAQADRFCPTDYHPEKWAELFCAAGARYVVLTSKHHDGMALFDTATDGLSVVRNSACGRDLVAPYCAAMRDAGLRVGLYYSHLDWNHPAYPSIVPRSDEWWARSRYNCPPDEKDHPEEWGRFLAFHRAQLTALLDNYGHIDLLWFDGVWERPAEFWHFDEMAAFIRRHSPGTVINDRIGGHGDYRCPEQGVPTVPPEGDWELCMTLNDNWSYVPTDCHFKPLREIVRVFVDCISGGGNLLLGIGPCPDGSISPEYERRLRELGNWIAPRAEAIYDTERGLDPRFFLGGSTFSADHRDLYLFQFDRPLGELCIKGLKSEPVSITVVGGSGKELPRRRVPGFLQVPGLLWFTLPDEEVDPVCTVIRLHFDEPAEIYLGEGGGIVS